MKKNAERILLYLLILVSVIVIGANFLWAPVCDGLLELKSGNMTHMKCFYTGKATVLLAIILLLTSIVALVSKNRGKAVVAVVSIVIGILLLVVTYDSILGIGICKKDTMACHDTALWVRISGIASIIIGAVMAFLRGKSEEIKF